MPARALGGDPALYELPAEDRPWAKNKELDEKYGHASDEWAKNYVCRCGRKGLKKGVKKTQTKQKATVGPSHLICFRLWAA